MTFSPTEKAERYRQRLIEKSREFQSSTYIRRFVAPLFQRLIRCEAGAMISGEVLAVVNGVIDRVFRERGQATCITCGRVDRWDGGIGGMHTGHFIGSRCNSILFEETNVAPQCPHCNVYRHGAPQEFRLWMEVMHGNAEIERLERLRNKSKSYSREELVDMRIAFQARLKAAMEKMNCG